MVTRNPRLTRGDVWWAELDPPIGRRPVVLVSRQSGYRQRDLMLVVPVTRTFRRGAGQVVLGLEEGLRETCFANAETIATLAQSRLLNRAGALSVEKLFALDDALRYALDLG